MSRLLSRHGIVGILALLLTAAFWYSRPEWEAEMRFWRAVGDASLLLLFAALAFGPLARLGVPLGRTLAYRRELGVWFGLLALLHTLLIWNGWARWDVARFLGYEFIPELGRLARLEPGFGFANLVGLTAMLITLVLMATSSDVALRRLGSSWKFLQLASYTVFYLTALHTAYFLFMHYTASFHRAVPDTANWFRWPFIALTFVLVALQIAAFVQVARRTTARRPSTAER